MVSLTAKRRIQRLVVSPLLTHILRSTYLHPLWKRRVCRVPQNPCLLPSAWEASTVAPTPSRDQALLPSGPNISPVEERPQRDLAVSDAWLRLGPLGPKEGIVDVGKKLERSQISCILLKYFSGTCPPPYLCFLWGNHSEILQISLKIVALLPRALSFLGD